MFAYVWVCKAIYHMVQDPLIYHRRYNAISNSVSHVKCKTDDWKVWELKN